MTMDRENEREIELETAMYTNFLLLGLDPEIIGVGTNTGSPRVGQFRHSNPKLGEQLLHFILTSLRGPIQSAKDFDQVWPIIDTAQSRDFRKVVQGIISELESVGALPSTNSRVSSLATCCGPRFVELLWQLSVHALREVHKQTFSADVASNPLPAPLTDVALSHGAALLPVTKARITLERRRFLKNAETAVQRQALWSNLAHEMTAEFRDLCSEEAYLQLELEKLHDLRNKVKLEGEHWDEIVSSFSQNAHMVQRATHLWGSLLSRKNQHEVLASGPIEDLMTYYEHRYRISGSSLLAAMGQSSLVPSSNLTPKKLDNEETEGSQADVKNESRSMLDCSLIRGNEAKNSQVDNRNMRGQPSVDIAEVLQRWTHALQRIHKQSLQLAKANDGEDPDLLSSMHDGGTNSHAEALAETLSEHRQYLNNIQVKLEPSITRQCEVVKQDGYMQVLINQLKDVAPTIQNSISELLDEVNCLSSDIPPSMKLRSNSPIQAQCSGRVLESGPNVGMTSRLSSVQLEKVSSPPTLKLPPLFSSTPNSSGKGRTIQKPQTVVQIDPIETITGKMFLEQPPNSHVNKQHDEDIKFLQNLRRSVREAALSSRLCNTVSSQDSHSDESPEYFIVSHPGTGFSRPGQYKKHDPLKSDQLFTSQSDSSLLQIHTTHTNPASKYSGSAYMLNDLDSLDEYDGVDGFLSANGSNSPVSDTYKSFIDIDEAQDQVFSPPFFMDAVIFADSYEDLLAPLSDAETALLEH